MYDVEMMQMLNLIHAEKMKDIIKEKPEDEVKE